MFMLLMNCLEAVSRSCSIKTCCGKILQLHRKITAMEFFFSNVAVKQFAVLLLNYSMADAF